MRTVASPYSKASRYDPPPTAAACLAAASSARSPEGGPESERVLGPGSHILQPGGVTHAELNAGPGDSVAMVYFDGPVDFVLAE